ncbi:hypothetical protein T265_05362 [Opisthorchis viverrini]|uniref:Uncharacterized protein n=1 Tax=Opisthorchis viverrini TaxID=6198 RepID=A0A074ZJY4_OPIVI|nr:hypothetical protein T265_05362 [Opisthorchis viverrini]KER27643.1 hypothetical protein T265_05362 [Opisthorchis viverrini]
MPTNGQQDNMRNDGALKSVLLELESKKQDLAAAAELGRTLLASNEELQREHQTALEAFRQQIHELENERRMLQLRLETVENDYDLQIKELQNNITSMRIDVQMQKNMYRQLENDRLCTISELTQQNQSMAERLRVNAKTEARLKQEISLLRSQCNQRKSSMHDNLHLLESLRQEITKLRSEKNTLEIKLQALTEERNQALTEERNQLLDVLSECTQRIGEMEQVQQEQMATINSQDNEIAHLQQRATLLQEHIHSLSTHQNSPQSRSSPLQTVRPHQSLLAELAEQRLELLSNAPLELMNESVLGLDDDDGVEMDDDTLLAYVNALNAENSSNPVEPIPTTSNECLTDTLDTTDGMIAELRLEVAEIYQQMRQMCVELQALSNAQGTSGALLNGGAHTPDELAMVEMDFRLSSLRSVLGDLRGLLRELVSDTTCKEKPITRPRKNCQEEIDPVEAMLNERDALANEVASAQQRLSNLQQQVENESQKVNANKLQNEAMKSATFVANWQELDDDDYEFEMPQDPKI